jgi:hypothetical protein
MERVCSPAAESFVDKDLEDHPPEIGTLEELLVLTACSVVLIEGIPTEGATPAHEFVQEDLFVAAGTGCVGGMHSGSHDVGLISFTLFEDTGPASCLLKVFHA